MRLVPCSAILLLAACNAGGGVTSPPGPEDPAARVSIRGRVYDSLTGAPLAGVLLQVGDKVAETGADGSYQASVSVGGIVVRVRFGLYEEFRLQVPAVVPAIVDLPLRRLHPALMACAIARDSVVAVVVDLQGRKTMNRADDSKLRLTSGGADTSIVAWDWTWRAVDPVTWRVMVPTRGRNVTRAVWTLRDQQGFGDLVDCATVPAPPALPDPTEPNPA